MSAPPSAPPIGGLLRAPGAVLLVSCYELGHQPFAVATLAGRLRALGYRPRSLDLSVEPLSTEVVTQARFVAISVPMHTAMRLGTRVAERVRALSPAAHLCLYGHYALLNAAMLRERRLADSIFAGECEPLIAELLGVLADGEAAGGDLPLAGDATVRRGLDRGAFADISREGMPPLARYSHLVHGERHAPTGYVEASRGCLHQCRHCPIPPVYEGRFFINPRPRIIEDIERLVAAGARHITFGDPDFLNGPGHALALAREIGQRFAGLTFDFTAKVSHLLAQRQHLETLRAAGCLFIISALESLSDRVLTHLRKGHDAGDARRVTRLVHGAGIALRPTWVPFTPWTTRADYVQMLRFIADEGLVDHVDPVQLSVRLLVPPGSLLLSEGAIATGPADSDRLVHPWTHPDPQMDDLQRRVADLVARAATARQAPSATFA